MTSRLAPAAQPLELWYDAPAERWTEALPVGNGSLGAMVFGGVAQERLQLNLDTLWQGGPHSYSHPGAAEVLPELRRLLFAGEQRAAERLATERFMSTPLRQCAYQPLGDVWIELPSDQNAGDYRRALDLDAAVATTTYKIGDATFTRQVFASFPDQAMFITLTCDQPGRLDFVVGINSPHRLSETKRADERTLALAGCVGDGSPSTPEELGDAMRFAARVRVLETDGKLAAEDHVLRVSGASRATLAATAATNFKSFRLLDDAELEGCAQRMERLGDRSFSAALAAHQADYQPRFRAFAIELGEVPAGAAALPTDRRVLAAQETNDPALAALFLQYGRYLMLASSRPGSQPANLQGIWNDQLDPPWGSKYTTNINAEMNYWPCEPANLAACAEPLYAAIDDLVESGRETAHVHYDAPGWVLHHNFDLWRGTAPINASDHGIWPTGGAWLCEHLWQRYLYNGDREFLKQRAYPPIRAAAEFFADYLVEDPRDADKRLISGPSNSPEQGGLVMGPTMDHQIIRSLLANAIAAAETLDADPDLREKWAAVHARIAPNRIGKRGQLQEWLEDRDDPDNRHRHVSHLWGVYPGSEITPDQPELFAAARKSLEERGDGGTGWSRAWKINLWARLRDSGHAHGVLCGLLQLTDSPLTKNRDGGVYPNLFDAHPPFQIDGNFGAASGICEMLLQSHRTTADGAVRIELLPALPTAWPTGAVKGIRARGGFELDLTWHDGELQRARIVGKPGGRASLEYAGKAEIIELAAGEETVFDRALARP